PDLDARLDAIEAGKQDVIPDLDDIRAGAAAGAGAAPLADISWVGLTGEYSDLRNAPELAAVATSGDYADLNNKPAALSDFTNDLAVSFEEDNDPASLLS
ncbi:MAG: hypothetical protein K6G86_08545, partial [Bacteroidales bacterium]|nr:hypothetical protein [Bacteroidales bacterium]